MIISIDGYDGTGKTTLAKEISKERSFYYIEKPFILKYASEHNCSYEEAVSKTHIEEKNLKKKNDKITYYLEGIEWVKTMSKSKNIILDRGILTTYAVFGYPETVAVFETFLKRGVFFDKSIYLVADDYERRRRIVANNPNDEDLKYPIKWHENDLEEFATSHKLNYTKIITDYKTQKEVLLEALNVLDSEIENNYQLYKNILVKKK